MSAHANWREVPIPPRMQGLERDRRGFPVPFIVARTKDGEPVFTVNDERLTAQAIEESRCAICGGELEYGDLWWVGGPLSAFHPNGRYIDGPMHEECSTYALQVCPHLAAPKYTKRIDDLPAKARDTEFKSFMDPTVLPDRPDCFVQTRSVSFSASWPRGPQRYLTPVSHPPMEGSGPAHERFIDYRVWVQGKLIEDEEEATALIRASIQKSLQQPIQKPKIYMPDRSVKV